MRTLRLLCLLVAAAASCACASAPAHLRPEAKASFQMGKVLSGIEALQDLAIDAEAEGVMSTADARKVVQACVQAFRYARLLNAALLAGYTEADVQRQMLAKLRAVLQELGAVLSPKAYALAQPYTQAVLALLMVYGY